MIIDQTWYTKPKGIKRREAAGGVIIREENNDLFIALMYDRKFPFAYELPKGGIEKGEDQQTAAKREIIEEVGISDVQLVSYLGKKERLTITKKHWTTTHYYLFETTQKEGKPTDHTKEFILEWFAIDTLPEMFWPEQKRLLDESREKIKELIG